MSVNGFAELLEHVGHKIECVSYGQTEPVNAALECVDCATVLLDYDRDDTNTDAQ